MFDVLRHPTCRPSESREVAVLKVTYFSLKGGDKPPTCLTTESSGRIYICVYLKSNCFGVSEDKASASYDDRLVRHEMKRPTGNDRRFFAQTDHSLQGDLHSQRQYSSE